MYTAPQVKRPVDQPMGTIGLRRDGRPVATPLAYSAYP